MRYRRINYLSGCLRHIHLWSISHSCRHTDIGYMAISMGWWFFSLGQCGLCGRYCAPCLGSLEYIVHFDSAGNHHRDIQGSRVQQGRPHQLLGYTPIDFRWLP